ncbi:MAG: cell wall-binding repeat-containing protein [Actinobacteria bacterium]|nr:cell wall-binding repeat-containing protein [Actinomycetota bacterium]
MRAVIGALVGLLALLAASPASAAAPRSAFPGSAGSVVDHGGDGLVPTERYFGAVRTDTAALIAREGFDGAGIVLLARSDDFPDSLAASYLAGQFGAPVLLTSTSSLSSEALTAMSDIGASKVYVLGGPAAISDDVVTALQNSGLSVTRVAGPNRFATAAAIARAGEDIGRIGGDRTAIVASGENFPDAVVMGAIATQSRFPLLLSSRDALNAETADALDDLSIGTVIIPGGTAAVSKAVGDAIAAMGIDVIRLAGPNRVDTAVEIAEFAIEQLGFGTETLNFAVGNAFPDALALGPRAGSDPPGVILLSNSPSQLEPEGAQLSTFLAALKCRVEGLRIAGGPAAFDRSLEAAARELVSSDRGCSLTLSPTGTELLAGNDHTVRATTRDQFGVLKDGETVRFEVYRSTDGGSTFAEGAVVARTDVTGDNRDDDGDSAAETAGQATLDYEGPREPAVDHIVSCIDVDRDGCATVSDGGVVLDDDRAVRLVTHEWLQRPPIFTLTPTASKRTVNTIHTVTANLRDGFGVEQRGADIRFEVYRSTDGGSTFTALRSGEDQTGDNFDAGNDPVADGEGAGDATFSYPGPEKAEVHRIVACDRATAGPDGCARTVGGKVILDRGEVNADVSVTWLPSAPTALLLTHPGDRGIVNQTHQVRATVRDEFGNAVNGATVRYQVFRGPVGGPFTLLPPALVTDKTGDGRDDDGHIVTEATGVSTFDYRGPLQVGEDRIFACVDVDGDGCASLGGGIPSADPDDTARHSKSVIWEADVPASITATPVTAFNTVAESHTVTADSRDQHTNGADEVVTFEIFRSMDGGPFEPWGPRAIDLPGDQQRVRVDADGDILDPDLDIAPPSEAPGIATLTYVGPAQPAVDRIVACWDVEANGCAAAPDGVVVIDPNDEVRSVVTKTWLPGAAVDILVSPPTGVNPVGTSHIVTATLTDARTNPALECDGAPDPDPEGTCTVHIDVYRTFDDGTTWNEVDLNDPPVPADGDDLTGDGSDNRGSSIAEATGVATFVYTGPTQAPARDRIFVCVDVDADGCAVQTGTASPTLDGKDTPLAGLVTKNWVAGPPETLELLPDLPVNEVDSVHVSTANVVDTFGNGVPTDVRFEVWSSPDGGLTFDVRRRSKLDTTGDNLDPDGAAVAEAAGVATFSYRGPTAPRVDRIIACVDSDNDGCAQLNTTGALTLDGDDAVQDSTIKTWIPGPAASVTITPGASVNELNQPHTATARVTDRFGNPREGDQVTMHVFRSEDDGRSFVALGTPSLTNEPTDAAGEVDLGTYTSSVVAIDRIVACLDNDTIGADDGNCAQVAADDVVELDDEGGLIADVGKAWGPHDPAPRRILLDPVNATNVVGNVHAFEARLVDPFGRRIDDVWLDVDVFRSTDDGVSFAGPVVSLADKTGDDRNDNNVAVPVLPGVAYFDYGPQFATAIDTIVVCIDEGADGCASVVLGDVVPDGDDVLAMGAKTWEPDVPATVSLTPTSETNRAATGAEHTVSALVLDQYGNRVLPSSLRFEVHESDDPTGSGSFTEVDSEILETSGVFADRGEVDFTYPYAGAPQGAVHVIVACIDRDPSPDGCTESVGLSSGVPQVTLDDEDAPFVSASVVKRWAFPTTLELVAGTLAAATNPAGTTHTVTVELRDQFGAAMAGEDAVIELWRDVEPEGNGFTELVGASGTTGPDGRLSHDFTSTREGVDAIIACWDEDGDGACSTAGPTAVNTTTGEVTFTADDSPEVNVTATKVWAAAAPDLLTLEPETATNRNGEDHTVTIKLEDEFGNGIEDTLPLQVFRSFDLGANYTGPVIDTTVTTADDGTTTFTYSYTGDEAPVHDRIVVCVDDGDGDCATLVGGDVELDDGDELSASADKRWLRIILTPENVELMHSPDAETRTVGIQLIDPFGDVMAAETLTVEVFRSTDGGASFMAMPVETGTVITGNNGEATFEYQYDGTEGDAIDVIVVCIDTDGDGCADGIIVASGEPTRPDFDPDDDVFGVGETIWRGDP